MIQKKKKGPANWRDPKQNLKRHFTRFLQLSCGNSTEFAGWLLLAAVALAMMTGVLP